MNIIGVLLFFNGLLQLIYPFYSTSLILNQIILCLFIVTLLVVFFQLSRSVQILVSIMLLCAVFLIVYYHIPYEVWSIIITSNLAILSIFIFVPLLVLPFIRWGILDKFQPSEKIFQDDKKNYVLISNLAAWLGFILGFGVFRTLQPVISMFVQGHEKVIARALTRGFTSSILWSPYFATVALILSLLNIPLSTYLPIGIAFGIVYLLLVVTYGLFEFRGKREIKILQRSATGLSLFPVMRLLLDKKRLAFFLLVPGLLILMITFEQVLHIKMMVSVAMVSVLFYVVSILLSSTSNTAAELKTYLNVTLPKVTNEVVIFSTAIILGFTMAHTPISSFFSQTLQLFVSDIVFLNILFIILFIVIFSAIGVHVTVSVITIATNLAAEMFLLHPLLYSVTLMVGWAFGMLCSPMMAMNVIIAQIVSRSNWQIALWNWRFVCINSPILSIFITMMNSFIKI